MRSGAGNHRFGLHVVALYEAFKGLLALLIGASLLIFSDEALRAFVEKLITLFHMNPDHRIPQLFLHGIDVVSGQNEMMVAALVTGYVLLRFAEAYGLWRDKAWAEWLAIVSGGLYLPLEFYELYEGCSWFKGVITLGNLALVIYLLWIRRLKATHAE